MKAFNNNRQLKDDCLHIALKAQNTGKFHAFGHYFYEGRGNVSGVLFNDPVVDMDVGQDYQANWRIKLDIPDKIGAITDTIFGGLSMHPDKSYFETWAHRVLDAIPLAADLSHVPDHMIAYLLEQSEWLAGYSDEKACHGIGYMNGVFVLRSQGIDQSARLEEYYYKNIYPLHMSRYNATPQDCNINNYGWAVLRSLCNIDKQPSALHYVLNYIAKGSSRYLNVDPSLRWLELSNIFLRQLEVTKD